MNCSLRPTFSPIGMPYGSGSIHPSWHNDTSQARYDADAAELAWNRTLAFFNEYLSG